jgi:hypothetical protein
MASEPSILVRDWVIRAVTWHPARVVLKTGAHTYAKGRGRLLESRGKVPPIANIYAASAQKAGSQWMRALFDHPVVREHTGLFTVPQLDYNAEVEAGKALPAGTFVPGLYVPYETYLRIPHRYPHRVIYMFRDPRDLVVSGYFSAVKTHQDTHVEEVETLREQMRTVPFDEGLSMLIESAAGTLRDMQSWAGVTDPNVAIFKLEEVNADPAKAVARMFEHCEIDMSSAEFDQVLNETSREALQAKDLANRAPGAESHYRVDRKGYRDLFKPEHYAAMERIVPGLVEQLGYPSAI